MTTCLSELAMSERLHQRIYHRLPSAFATPCPNGSNFIIGWEVFPTVYYNCSELENLIEPQNRLQDEDSGLACVLDIQTGRVITKLGRT